LSAATPAAGKQAPALYRAKLGDFEITQIADGARTFPMPDTFVKNVSKDQALAAAEAAYMPKGQVPVPFNPIIINTGSKLVLIDTGYGPGITPSVGLLPTNMAAAGIDPKTIDLVILSHLHPDHINGVKTADGALAFPNAEIKASALDWAFWISDEIAGKAANDMMKGYFANTRKIPSNIADKVTKYKWGKEVAPGITAIDTRGHTPGHTSFVVASGSAKMLLRARSPKPRNGTGTACESRSSARPVIVYFESQDNCQFASISISQDKARTAARYRRPTLVFEPLLVKGDSYADLTTLDDVIASLH
jgi:glyoxylase-like metal-dependent hydrolase (beta-lactamase superfamily II)